MHLVRSIHVWSMEKGKSERRKYALKGKYGKKTLFLLKKKIKRNICSAITNIMINWQNKSNQAAKSGSSLAVFASVCVCANVCLCKCVSESFSFSWECVCMHTVLCGTFLSITVCYLAACLPATLDGWLAGCFALLTVVVVFFLLFRSYFFSCIVIEHICNNRPG